MVSEMIPCISFKSMQFEVSQHLAKLRSLSGSDVSYIIVILLLFCIETASRPQA